MIDRLREYLAQSKIAGLLEEIQYPISKQELMEIAEEHNAPEKVIELLDRLPETTFDSVMQVMESLRGAKEGE